MCTAKWQSKERVVSQAGHDAGLSALFRALPDRCVVLLEDIDAAASAHTREDDATKTTTSESESESSSGKRVSLSALLNALDGVASQDGRVLIMTTNYVERLDAALVRPGRVDKKVALGLAGRDLIIRLFDLIFRPLEFDDTHEGTLAKDDTALGKLAEGFADEVPEQEYSPAEILSFLLENRGSPQAPLENLQSWMARIREERKAVKRADSWALSE